MDWRGGLRKTKSRDGRENYTSISIDDEEEEEDSNISIDDEEEEEDSNNSLAISFRKQMEEMPEMPSERCIYRVPPSIRVLNEELYTPQTVSIGPFHHKKKELIGMEEHKLRCMKAFLDRPEMTTSLDDFIMAIKGFEKRARDCYAETINLSVDEFVKILIVDSFFIFEVMIESESRNFGRASNLPMPPCFFATDIILLENQIPFFVLKDLFLLAFPSLHDFNFLELSICYVGIVAMFKDQDKIIKKVEEYLNVGHEIKHFTDLLRTFHLPSASRITSANRSGEFISIPNAVELQEAGVQLLCSSDYLLDIKYTKSKLEIPVLVVYDSFELVMSNICILEGCHYLNDSYIGDYVFFMQMLVNTDKDAELLIRNNIIEGGSSTMAALFRKLRRASWVSDPYYLYDISNNLNTYCNVSRHRWKATFKRDYCSTPWRIASTTAAVILLILTLLSTIAAFLAL